MTKKYKLLINNSPEFPPNTIATEVDTDGVKTYVVQYHNGSRFLHASSVENRPTIWHEITEPKQSFKKWRAKYNKKYWGVTGSGVVCSITESRDKYCDYYYLTGNYFQTEQEAETHKAHQKAIGRVSHAIYEANDGWEPEWGNVNQRKWYIIKKHDRNVLEEDWSTTWHCPSTLPFCKTQEIALSIISSHKEDLEFIFNNL